MLETLQPKGQPCFQGNAQLKCVAGLGWSFLRSRFWGNWFWHGKEFHSDYHTSHPLNSSFMGTKDSSSFSGESGQTYRPTLWKPNGSIWGAKINGQSQAAWDTQSSFASAPLVGCFKITNSIYFLGCSCPMSLLVIPVALLRHTSWMSINTSYVSWTESLIDANSSLAYPKLLSGTL